MHAKVIGNLLITALGTIGFFGQTAYAAIGTMYDTRGDVKTVLGGQQPQSVGKGAPLENNMIVSTGEASSAVLKFEDGQIIALQSNSSFQIRDYSYDTKNVEKSSLFFSMLKGGLRAITGLIGAKHPAGFRLQTPNATIGIRGTDFMLVMQNPLYANVVSGSISISNTAGTAIFNAGQAAVVTSATTLPAAISAAAIPAGTFTPLGAIPVPVAPLPGAGSVPGGGASTGAAATTGVSTTAVAVGAAVAVGVAAASNNNSTTTHH